MTTHAMSNNRTARIQKWFDVWGGPIILIPLLLAMAFGFYHYAWEPMVLQMYPGWTSRWWWYHASILIEVIWIQLIGRSLLDSSDLHERD